MYDSRDEYFNKGMKELPISYELINMHALQPKIYMWRK